MRSVKQLLAIGLMASMVATSGGTFVSAAVPQPEVSVQAADDASSNDAQKAMEQYKKIDGIDGEKTILGADFTHYQQNIGWGKVWKDYIAILGKQDIRIPSFRVNLAAVPFPFAVIWQTFRPAFVISVDT